VKISPTALRKVTNNRYTAGVIFFRFHANRLYIILLLGTHVGTAAVVYIHTYIRETSLYDNLINGIRSLAFHG